jgi:hypothetical protein
MSACGTKHNCPERNKSAARGTQFVADSGFGPHSLIGREGPLMALKRPTVAPAEGLLTDAVLKHACVAPNRRR